MNERWVCKRCFADNEDGDAACVRCGLARDAEPTAADGTSLPAAAAAPEDPGWRRWLRFAWVPVVAVVLVVGYLASARRDDAGVISAGGTLSIEDLRVGDCFDAAEASEISEVEARPCTDAHEFELFHVAEWNGSGDYPSETAMTDFVIDECIPAFEEYVGTSFQTSSLDFVHFVPLEEGWNAGDRIFQCAVFDPDDTELTSSLAGSTR